MLVSAAPSISAPNTNTYVNPKQIAVSTLSSNQVMYTVPTGRKFQGWISGSQYSQTFGITPSGGTQAQMIGPTTTSVPGYLPVTFTAGTIITALGGSGPQYILGVETDV